MWRKRSERWGRGGGARPPHPHLRLSSLFTTPSHPSPFPFLHPPLRLWPQPLVDAPVEPVRGVGREREREKERGKREKKKRQRDDVRGMRVGGSMGAGPRGGREGSRQPLVSLTPALPRSRPPLPPHPPTRTQKTAPGTSGRAAGSTPSAAAGRRAATGRPSCGTAAGRAARSAAATSSGMAAPARPAPTPAAGRSGCPTAAPSPSTRAGRGPASRRRATTASTLTRRTTRAWPRLSAARDLCQDGDNHA